MRLRSPNLANIGFRSQAKSDRVMIVDCPASGLPAVWGCEVCTDTAVDLNVVLRPQRLQLIVKLELAVDENRMSVDELFDQATKVLKTFGLGAKYTIALTQLGQFQPVFVSMVVGDAEGN